MKTASQISPYLYRLLVGGAGLALLITSTFLPVPAHRFVWLLTPFIALQVNLSLSILPSEITLCQVIVLGAGLLYGPTMTGWATVAGILAGFTIQYWRQARHTRHAQTEFDIVTVNGSEKANGSTKAKRTTISKILEQALYHLGMQILPLVAAFTWSAALQPGAALQPNQIDWLRGIASLPEAKQPATQIWPAVLLPMMLFIVLQGAFFLGEAYIHHNWGKYFRKDLRTFLLVELLPLPFILLLAILYPVNNVGVLLALVALTTLVAVLLFYLFKISQELQRRLQELSTLNHISRALRSTTNLQDLLTVIHQQVTGLLGVDSFYVALYDPAQGRLWYPLAVKYGQRQAWPPRGLMPDRLTDRVIQQAKPIRVTPQNRNELALAGVPPMDDLMAWVGVPLIASEKTIGCLAAFGFIPDKEFTPGDITLLTTLSGQVSVAIENALLFEQLHRRASQLENLNHIMALITASLDTQKVLAQVCRSAAQLVGGQRSAIYLLEAGQENANLAYAFGFSAAFSRQNRASTLFRGKHARALRTDHPALTEDIRTSTLERDLALALQREGIQAMGDFPLTTPDGQIGILSVYFDVPHTFHPDEVDLLQTLASQASVAVANARLYASTDQALARRANQLAILEAVSRELSAAISSPGLFETILSHALQFTQSPWGMLALHTTPAQSLEIKASHGYEIAKTQLSLEDGLVREAFQLKQAININDTQKITGCLNLTEGASRSQLYVPLIHEERVRGILILESPEEAAYSASDQAFISQLALQAAVAVINAELYNETQHRLNEQAILYRISASLVGNPELEDILQATADSLAESMPAATAGIYLWDENASTYQMQQIVNTSRPNCHMPEKIHDTELGMARPALLKTGPLRLPSEKKDTGLLVSGCGHCRALVLPLVVKQQRQGMILLHFDPDQTVAEDESQLLHAIGAEVSLALQNTRLFRAVSRGHDQLTAVLNSVGEAILLLTNDGYILVANQPVERLTGIALDQLIGQPLIELPEQVLRICGYTVAEAETLVKNLEQEHAFPFPKVTFKLPGGLSEKVLERSIEPVWGQANRAVGWMIVLRDVTEENQIAEARELITQTLVHDLRSPISSILGAVGILDDAFPSEKRDEMVDQALRVARNGSQRVLSLVETLMDIARMQSGKIDLNLNRIDLYQLVSSTVSEFVAQAKQTNIHLLNEVPKDLPKIRADNAKIRRVFTNLLDNALKFTPENGQVSIAAEQNPPGTIAIHVSDTGPGIPEEFREKVFDRFSQVPGQRGRRRGSGLGLTFCKLAIEAHTGHIWVEPCPGGGSTFTVTLPVDGPPAVG